MKGFRFISSVMLGALTILTGACGVRFGAERITAPLVVGRSLDVYLGLLVIVAGLVVIVSNVACLAVYGED